MSVEAWQAIALGEEAAVYAYGVLAAQLEEPERGRAIDSGVAHARSRDRAQAALRALDAAREVPAAFEIPFPLTTADAARRLAVLLESRLVDVYCTQVSELEPGERKLAALAAQECAARAITWGGEPAAFPGGANVAASPSPTASTPTAATPPQSPTPPPTTTTPAAVTSPGSDGATVVE